MAGTCCQSLSVVRQENDKICSGLKGKSGIFFEYARAVKEIQPKWFLLENVVPKSKTDQNIITDNLGGANSSVDKFKSLFCTRQGEIVLDEYSYRFVA